MAWINLYSGFNLMNSAPNHTCHIFLKLEGKTCFTPSALCTNSLYPWVCTLKAEGTLHTYIFIGRKKMQRLDLQNESCSSKQKVVQMISYVICSSKYVIYSILFISGVKKLLETKSNILSSIERSNSARKLVRGDPCKHSWESLRLSILRGDTHKKSV